MAWAWRVGLSLAAASAVVAPAHAALSVQASESNGAARLVVSWPQERSGPAPTVTAALEGGALIVRASEPISADPAAIVRGAPRAFAFVRSAEDGRALRIALRRSASPSVARDGASFVVTLAAQEQAAAAAPEPAAGAGPSGGRPLVQLTAGVRDEFTRLSVTPPRGARMTANALGDEIVLRFDRALDIDLSALNVSPPARVRGARVVSQPGQPLSVRIQVQPGTRMRRVDEGDRAMIDLLPAPAPTPAQAAATPSASVAQAAQAAASNPVPRGGAVRVELVEGPADTRLSLRWAGPARAAAFRRGEAIWLVFDANARLELSGAPQVGRRHTSLRAVTGEGVTALRVGAPPQMQVSARADGPVWVFTLAERADPVEAAPVRREQAPGGVRMVVDFQREGVVRWIEDPAVGDRFGAALLAGPARGVDMRRSTIEAAILPAAHGVGIEAHAEGVGAAFENGALVVSRGAGLIGAIGRRLGQADRPPPPPPLAGIGLLDLVSWGSSGGTFLEVKDDLQRRAAEEGFEPGAQVSARIALARFLLAHEMAHEALGALKAAAVNQPQLEVDPEYRLMRAAALLMIGRRQEGGRDLAIGQLANDPSAALWRGYAATLAENWPEARRQFELGRGAISLHPPSWRTRFNLGLGEAALRLNDFAAAESAIEAALADAPTRNQQAAALAMRARLMKARGDLPGALKLFEELAASRDEATAVRAALEAIRIKREQNAMTPEAAVDALEGLRFRWRGDALELEIIMTLGRTYTEMGRWREGLSVMRAASVRFGDAPAARKLRLDMAEIFERLFLHGEMDDMEPIQSLGLFYEFRDLTPFGPDGDRMIRLLAGRLADLDLLEQAAELLRHQVDNRLEGVGRAQIAADLAAIYLDDRKPQEALAVIANTRQPNLPAAIVGERRILEAQALLQLGRFDHALELLERDQSEAAQRLRADVAWRRREWTQAAAEIQRLIDRTRQPGPLDAPTRNMVLRAAAARVFAEDRAGLEALRRAYAASMANTPEDAAFELITGASGPGDARLIDAARTIARTDLIQQFLDGMRERLRTGRGAGDPPAPPAPAAANAQAPARPA